MSKSNPLEYTVIGETSDWTVGVRTFGDADHYYGVCLTDVANVSLAARLAPNFRLIDCTATSDAPMAVAALALLLLGTIGAVLAASCCDRKRSGINNRPIARTSSQSKIAPLMEAFAVRRNWASLFGRPPKSASANAISDSTTPLLRGRPPIDCLHGIRFMATCWCLVGHAFGLLPGFVSNYPTLYAQMANSVWHVWISNFGPCVDVFFTLSGCLCAYGHFLRCWPPPCAEQPTQPTPGLSYWLRFYAHRLVRLWPALACSVLALVALMSLLPTRPFWAKSDPTVECWRNGWQPLLFANSLPTMDGGRCMPWSWYLSAECVLYLCAPPFLALMVARPRAGYAALVVATVASCTANWHVMAHYNFPPFAFGWARPSKFNNDSHLQLRVHYSRPWYRAGPFLIGIGLGRFLASAAVDTAGKEAKHVVTVTYLQRSLHFAAVAAALWALIGHYPAVQDWDWPPRAYHLFYGSTHRTVFALALSWLIYHCHVRAHGSWLSRLLGHRLLVTLSTLSYAVYLFHIVPILLSYFWLFHPPLYEGAWRVLLACILQLAGSYVYSLLSYLLVERPAVVLYQSLVGSEERRENNPSGLVLPKRD